jgi:hypothetical protein
VLTRDGGVPVISHAYPGDRPDVSRVARGNHTPGLPQNGA